MVYIVVYPFVCVCVAKVLKKLLYIYLVPAYWRSYKECQEIIWGILLSKLLQFHRIIVFTENCMYLLFVHYLNMFVRWIKNIDALEDFQKFTLILCLKLWQESYPSLYAYRSGLPTLMNRRWQFRLIMKSAEYPQHLHELWEMQYEHRGPYSVQLSSPLQEKMTSKTLFYRNNGILHVLHIAEFKNSVHVCAGVLWFLIGITI